MTHNIRLAPFLQSGVDARKPMWAEFLKEVSILISLHLGEGGGAG